MHGRRRAPTGSDDTDVVVLPTVILDADRDGARRAGSRSARRSTPSFRFDQIAALYALHRAGEARGAIDPLDGITRLNEIGAMRPRYGWFVRTFGHALLTTGLALLLAPTWQGALVAFVLGAFIGLAKLVRSPTLQLVFPVFAAFACALAVFLIAPYVEIGDPIRLLIAPLATFLPGGVLTTGDRRARGRARWSPARRGSCSASSSSRCSRSASSPPAPWSASTSSTYVSLEASDALPWWIAIGRRAALRRRQLPALLGAAVDVRLGAARAVRRVRGQQVGAACSSARR